jgi:hypothetical protein
VADVHVWLRAVVIAEPDAIVTPNAWKASARSTTGWLATYARTGMQGRRSPFTTPAEVPLLVAPK